MPDTQTPPAPTASPFQLMSPNTPTLSDQINVATRKQHANLNRLILERIGRTLPPNASDPRKFGEGLAAFARIYYVFEAIWQELSLLEDLERGTHEDEVLKLLLCLRSASLDRTKRLRNDIYHLSMRAGVWLECHAAEQQQGMLDVMIRSLRAKPHTLIAYAWVMYMAIFSGGRWIRSQLATAGPGFWTGNANMAPFGKDRPLDLRMPGFSFLSFDTEDDGEDVKALFKLRLQDADELLTAQEKEEVVRAAQDVFENCIRLVVILDSSSEQRTQTEMKPFPRWVVRSVGTLLVIGILWGINVARALGEHLI